MKDKFSSVKWWQIEPEVIYTNSFFHEIRCYDFEYCTAGLFVLEIDWLLILEVDIVAKLAEMHKGLEYYLTWT